MNLQVKKLYSDAIIPTYGSEFAAGLDLYAYGEYTVPAKTRKVISTAICIEWFGHDAYNYYMRIAPRSGLSVKNSIDIGAGVIDYDYRGEIKICFINNSDIDYNIKHGDRIAQGILEKIIRFTSIEDVEELGTTNRGNSGFGSSGV
jgi:dUTP pyrophosphatase